MKLKRLYRSASLYRLEVRGDQPFVIVKLLNRPAKPDGSFNCPMVTGVLQATSA